MLASPSGVGSSLLRTSPLDLPEKNLDPLRTQHNVVFAKAWTTGPRMGPSSRLEGTGEHGPRWKMGIPLAASQG